MRTPHGREAGISIKHLNKGKSPQKDFFRLTCINILILKSQMILKPKQRLWFMSCGISKAGFLEEGSKLEYWLNKKTNGEMSYVNFDMRLDLKIVEGAKSVISLTYIIYRKNMQRFKFRFQIYMEMTIFVIK